MNTVEIGIEPREGRGKGPARRLRAAGRIPAIVYGRGKNAVAVAVSAIEFERKVASLEGAHLVSLRGSGGLPDAMVLLKEIQEHPVSGRVLHADFLEVDLSKQVMVMVSLHFTGRCVGVVAGGILQPVLREIEVRCLPTNIPEFIEVDVSSLEIHGSLHLRDLVFPIGVEPITDVMQTLVTVAAPVSEAAPVEGAPAEGAGEGSPSTGPSEE